MEILSDLKTLSEIFNQNQLKRINVLFFYDLCGVDKTREHYVKPLMRLIGNQRSLKVTKALKMPCLNLDNTKQTLA